MIIFLMASMIFWIPLVGLVILNVVRLWTDRDDGGFYCVVVEPSPFRRDETFVVGPLGRRAALRRARREVRRNPYGEAIVLPAGARIALGDRELEWRKPW